MLMGDLYQAVTPGARIQDEAQAYAQPRTPTQIGHQAYLLWDSMFEGVVAFDYANPRHWQGSTYLAMAGTPVHGAADVMQADTPANVALNIASGRGQLWI